MNNTVGLFLMNRKGFLVLESLVRNGRNELISFVESRKDKDVVKDYFEEIKQLCIENNICFYDNSNVNLKLNDTVWKIAVGWRWLIKDINKLIIIHDSLLPKYRGFAPLVNALINGEKTIGVTALIASESYDRGDILLQESMNVYYPVKIKVIIEKISDLYIKCINNLLDIIISGKKLTRVKQDESKATYSIWRDSEDYFIDWSWPADKIKRFVDAVGFPYQGAMSRLEENVITIEECEVIEEFKAEIQHPGKVVFFENEMPVVICGEKALRINKMTLDNQDYKMTKLKSRFR
jgi:methionyl-tRNA formyltransferase